MYTGSTQREPIEKEREKKSKEQNHLSITTSLLINLPNQSKTKENLIHES